MLNDQTFEFSQARLRLKDGLRFSMRAEGGPVAYLVEDEITGRFFHVGLPQYTFLSMLDGQRTVSTALMKTATLLREHALNESQAASLCRWAIETGLIESELGSSGQRRTELQRKMRQQKVVSYLNPLMMRVPLFNPDRIISVFATVGKLVVNPVGVLIWFIVVLSGFIQLGRHWDDFYANGISSFGASDLIWIAVTWLILKLLHELGHSIVCKRYGGRVQSCGFLLLLLIPLPYVDVTSAWKFESKWKRIFTSSAGMMCELFIAAIACFLWVSAEPGPLKYHAANVIISASLHTLLFNINPLMRFDGYYILCDLLELPNLAMNGRAWLKTTAKRLYFGSKASTPIEGGFRGFVIRSYGILSMMWFSFITISLSLAASSLIEGFGLVVVCISMILWLGIPLFKLAKHVVLGSEIDPIRRGRFAFAVTATALIIGGFFILCPAPTVVSAPLVIDYEPMSIIRSKTPGFAESILFNDGDFVEEGQLLVALSNPELHHEFESVRADVEISHLRSQTLYALGEISQYQIEQEQLSAARKRMIELQLEVENLSIRAPQAGIVMKRELSELEGKYIKRGDEVLAIAESDQLHAKALARQADIEWIDQHENVDVDLRIWGRHESELLRGRISNVNPRASNDVPHPALTATVGGPLAVVAREQVESASDSEQDWMLTEPRVKLEIDIQPEDRVALLAGQTGEIEIRVRDQNMGSFLAENLIAFIRRNNFRTHGL